MADTVRKVVYFKMSVPDKAGEGARVLGALRDAGVNLLAFSGFPRGRRAQLDLVPEDEAGFRFSDERFAPGEYVSVIRDGKAHPYRVISLQPL